MSEATWQRFTDRSDTDSFEQVVQDYSNAYFDWAHG